MSSGLDEAYAKGTIRIAVRKDNIESEIRAVVDGIGKMIKGV